MVKDPPASAGNTNLIPGLGRFPGDDNNNPLQYSFLGQRSLVGYCLWGHKGVDPLSQWAKAKEGPYV